MRFSLPSYNVSSTLSGHSGVPLPNVNALTRPLIPPLYFFDRYYVNTLTNTTQWEAPPGFGAADWTAAVDAGSGKTYYYHARTNVTQWEAPPGFSDSGASAAAAAPAVTTAPAKVVAAPRAAVQRRAVVAAQEEEPKTVRFDARCDVPSPNFCFLE